MGTDKTAAFLKRKIRSQPEIAFILGSGLGGLADLLENRRSLPYAGIPGFPASGVKGHANTLFWGDCAGRSALVFSGRFHYYEGFGIDQVVLPVRLARQLGCRILVVTNAAGAVNRSFRPGDVMLIRDHLNMMGTNPLIGYRGPGQKFVAMTRAYDPALASRTVGAARGLRLRLRTGVYAALSGPSYETPAEIAMLRRLGADAVGMSTVPEVIVARQEGMSVLGLSLITNMAAGVTAAEPDHEEVLAASLAARDGMIGLLGRVMAGNG